jgi:TetR/AcrR family transcriptional repressor of nem operon
MEILNLTRRQTEILDLAQKMIQTRGYNGFSFKDLAEALQVKPAAIHYHFPAKVDLGRALMARYRHRLHLSLTKIDGMGLSPRRALERYIQLFYATLKPDNRLCLCGMLATELITLPEPLQEDVRVFFQDNEAWLARTLGEGRASKALEFEASSAAVARCVYATLHGAMLSAHTFGDPSRLHTAGRWLLESLVQSEVDALLVPVHAPVSRA